MDRSLSAVYQRISSQPLVVLGAGAALGGLAVLGASRYRHLSKSTTKPWTMLKSLPSLDGSTREEGLINHVYASASHGDPASVLKAMDAYCYQTSWMMAVGDTKGALLRAEVVKAAPKLAIEMGGYCGYSAILIGSQLTAGSKLISIEINPVFAAISTKIIELAGLSEKVEVWVSDVATALPKLLAKYGPQSVDLVFIDHVKTFYLRDIKHVESLNLLHKGSVVIGDNIITPGAPDYLAYMQSSPAFSTVLHHTLLEYQDSIKDAVSVSVKL